MTPAEEAALGRAMLALARAEGHRPAAPARKGDHEAAILAALGPDPRSTSAIAEDIGADFRRVRACLIRLGGEGRARITWPDSDGRALFWSLP